jgi:poly(3-hydroxybutyrate) depolymerase
MRWTVGLAAIAFCCALWAQDDVADVPSQTLYAENDKNKMYFLIGSYPNTPAPKEGYRLLLILPGGDGSADFHPFCKRIYKYALDNNYLVAQLVAPKWSDDQFEKVVWPTKGLPWETAKFTTEEFIEAVIADVRKRHSIDSRYIFALGWSSGGPPVYAAALQEKTSLRGVFVAMSVFKPNQLPPSSMRKGAASTFCIRLKTLFLFAWRSKRSRSCVRTAGVRSSRPTKAGTAGGAIPTT